MSRSGYTDDCEHLGIYRAGVDRALRGRRGQRFISRLADALDAMPCKALTSGALVDADGGCCALGSVALADGMPALVLQTVDEYDTSMVGRLLDIAPSLAAEVAYLNDELGGSDGERWTLMREWAREHTLAPAR